MISADPVLAGVLGATLGLVFGSYLVTLLSRATLPVEDRRQPRSRCDSCRRQLAWFELVPIVAFALQRGRCRRCGAAIDPIHPAVEALCGAIGAACFAAGAPLLAPLGWLAVILALFDARHLWLPDRLVAALAASALAAPAWSQGQPMLVRLAGGALGFAALWLVAAAYRRVRAREGLGGGDPKLFGAIGLWVGPAGLPVVLLAACALGLVDALRRAKKGADVRTLQLPLGTYLAIATLLFIAGKLISAW